MSYRKVGGLHFVRLGIFSVSFCVTRKHRKDTCEQLSRFDRFELFWNGTPGLCLKFGVMAVGLVLSYAL